MADSLIHTDILTAAYFSRDAEVVAADLIGCFLCRRLPDGSVIRSKITETEAYTGPEDAACHAFKNRKTRRTQTMFGEPGTFYVYLCYGVHWLLNVVVREKGYPAAVLLRGVEGHPGPGRLTRAFSIDRAFNQQRATPEVGLWFQHGVAAAEIMTGPRIGIGYAAEPWLSAHLRWFVKG